MSAVRLDKFNPRGQSALTIGKFDGVHVGHGRLLEELRLQPYPHRLILVFDRHPRRLLTGIGPGEIMSLDQRCAELAKFGQVVVMAFDQKLARTSAEDFVRETLVGRLHARKVIAGKDFRFGRGAMGTTSTLRDMGRELGFGLTVVDSVLGPDGSRVSSSSIKDDLRLGRLDRALRLLGRAHVCRSRVVYGNARGLRLGFPTANLEVPPQGLTPAEGVYAGWLRVVDDDSRYTAAISVGKSPSFGDVEQTRVEAYCLGAKPDLNLYDRVVEVGFCRFLRPQMTFSSVPELVDQIDRDVSEVRVYMGQKDLVRSDRV